MKLIENKLNIPLDIIIYINKYLYEKLNDNNWKLLEINSELIAFKNIKKIYR